MTAQQLHILKHFILIILQVGRISLYLICPSFSLHSDYHEIKKKYVSYLFSMLSYRTFGKKF